jgi:hypothetical protein
MQRVSSGALCSNIVIISKVVKFVLKRGVKNIESRRQQTPVRGNLGGKPEKVPESWRELNLNTKFEDHFSLTSPHVSSLHLFPFSLLSDMFARTLRKSIASPLRRNAFVPVTRPAFRTVTTDAASSHADKESVPEVGPPIPTHKIHN